MGLTINNLDSSSFSNIFSSLGTNNLFSTGSSSSSSSILSDYYSIKNGSYYKMMKAYYDIDSDSEDTSKTSTANKSNATKVKSSASDLKNATADLLKSDTFAMKEKVGEDGKTTKSYDVDSIYNKVSAFVDSYNSLVKFAGDSASTGVLTNVSTMTTFTNVNSNMLSKIGITVGTDNKLKLDADDFKAADMSVVKSLFGSTGGYGYQINAQASSSYNYANSQLTSGYGNDGSYAYTPISTFSIKS